MKAPRTEEAVWLCHSPKGAGRREQEAGALAAEAGQPDQTGTLSSQTGPGSPAPAPYPHPWPPLFKQALGLLLHGNRRLLFQSDVAALFSTVCFSLKSCHQPDLTFLPCLSLSFVNSLLPKGQDCISRACLSRAEGQGPTDRWTDGQRKRRHGGTRRRDQGATHRPTTTSGVAT